MPFSNLLDRKKEPFPWISILINFLRMRGRRYIAVSHTDGDPSVAAKILNCQYGFSLTARDVSEILSALEEANAVASAPEQNADQAD